MKNIKKYITALGLLTAVVSCDNLQDLNVNPSFPVDVSTQALLPPIEQQMGHINFMGIKQKVFPF